MNKIVKISLKVGMTPKEWKANHEGRYQTTSHMLDFKSNYILNGLVGKVVPEFMCCKIVRL